MERSAADVHQEGRRGELSRIGRGTGARREAVKAGEPWLSRYPDKTGSSNQGFSPRIHSCEGATYEGDLALSDCSGVARSVWAGSYDWVFELQSPNAGRP